MEMVPAQALFTPSHGPDEFERVRWIQKAARALRGGRTLTDRAVIDQLIKKTDAEIVDYFIATPDFGDTILDFNLFVLGFRKDRLREPDGELSWQIFDFASAITSARETMKDGDYFTLFEYEQPMYLPRLKTPWGYDSSSGKSEEEVRAEYHADIQDGLRKLMSDLRANPSTSLDKACAMFLDETKEGQHFSGAGYWFSLVDLGFYSNIWYGWVLEACTGAVRPAGFNMITEIEKILAVNERLIADIKHFEPVRYSTRNLADIRALDVKAIGLAPRWNFFGDAIRQAIMNSSTSFNRKRGAWALSRFFCDDLTPIGVETPPGPPPSDRHGSEPACMACHYKLDPMAGFFRDFGYLFSDYSSATHIRFDDNAAMSRDQYQKAWRAQSTTAGRTWNVGYVRSTTKENLNSYGSSIEDLFRIVRTEPEVKRCLTRRMFEFLVSDQQALDAGYLDHLAAEFTATAKSNSSHAIKALAKKIVLSESFREADPISDKCYDYPPGYDPAGKPPCKVAHVLKKNCVLCHSSTANFPFLNLASWVQLPDGTLGFPHLDSAGQQLASKVTLERILDRLTTTDTTKRMPARRHMDPLDRETLFRWTNSMLNPAAASLHFAKQEYVCPRAKR